MFHMSGDFAQRLGTWQSHRGRDDVITLMFRRRSDGGLDLICEAVTPSGDVKRHVIRGPRHIIRGLTSEKAGSES
jgi:hypothetical protein